MKRKWIWIVAFPAIGLAAWGVWQNRRPNPDEVEWRSIRVQRGDIQSTVLTTGAVEPQNRVEIKPPIGGRIEDVIVREGDVIRKGQIVAWMSSTERAALLDAARTKGAEELQRWSQLYKPAPLVAPIDGTVIARNVEPGQTVAQTDAVLVMSDRLIVKAQVDETDIGSVLTGQRAMITLDAYPKDEIAGVVDHIAFEAQTVNNVTVYAVDVLPDEAPAFMRSGMTANVTFRIASKENVLLVPAEAVRERDGEFFVLLADGKDDDSKRQPVETGLTDGKRIEIVSGLDEDQTILVAHARMSDRRGPERSNPFSPFRQRSRSR